MLELLLWRWFLIPALGLIDCRFVEVVCFCLLLGSFCRWVLGVNYLSSILLGCSHFVFCSLISSMSNVILIGVKALIYLSFCIALCFFRFVFLFVCLFFVSVCDCSGCVFSLFFVRLFVSLLFITLVSLLLFSLLSVVFGPDSFQRSRYLSETLYYHCVCWICWRNLLVLVVLSK